MAPLNEITSTEKLLDFIRKKSGSPFEEREGSENAPPPLLPQPRKSIANLIPFRSLASLKTVTVGIYIGQEYLWMAKTTKGADGMPVLVDKRQVLLPSSLNRRSVAFTTLLRAELDTFCDRQKKQRIWAIMSAAGIEVRHVRIPKVPKKQIENAVLWTVKKETPFDEKENIFDFEVLGEVIDQGIPKFAIMYYMAPRRIVEETKKMFSDAGWPLTGLSIAPFALQNIFRTKWAAGYEGTIASLFIGNDFSRIDIFTDGNLVMTRGIKAGINSMLESLIDGLHGRVPPVTNAAGDVHGDIDRAKKILFSLSPDSPPLEENDPGYGLKEEEIWQMVLPAFERLVRQAERTFEHFTVTLGNAKVDKIYVSAAMNVYLPIGSYVGGQLNIESDMFDPLNQRLSERYDDMVIFSCDSERIAIVPALGIALSDNTHTPNLLFTYKDKANERTVKRMNGAMFLIFVAIIAVLNGMFAYQLHAKDQKRKTLQQLEQQLSRDKFPVSQEMILKTLSTVRQDAASAKVYSQRYQGLAVISELSQLTPPGIRLLSVKANLGNISDSPAAPVKSDAPAAKPKEEMNKGVEIEGFVVGDKKTLNNALANYVIKLDTSPLFHQIKVQKTNEEAFRKAVLLRFTVSMSLEGL